MANGVKMKKEIKSVLLIVILIGFVIQGKAVAQNIVYVSNQTIDCAGNSPCYSRINSALSDVASDTEIRIEEGTYDEDVALTTNKIVKLAGGWDQFFDEQSGDTIIYTLTVEKESVTIDKITIQLKPLENCCISGICSPLSSRVCLGAGGIPLNGPCVPNPCSF